MTVLPLRAPLIVLGLALLLSACSATPPPQMRQIAYDPWEPVNRRSFQLHQIVDRTVLIPAASGYRLIVPKPGRLALRNAMRNLGQPLVLINAALQGDGQAASETSGRFLVNTTLGLAGILDIASSAGIPAHEADFGQTLAVWGVRSGPYLFLPILGPSSVRDSTGRVVDTLIDPVGYGARQVDNGRLFYAIGHGVTALDLRARNLETLAQLENSSLDFYATVRSLYWQRRNAMIGSRHPITEDQSGAPLSPQGRLDETSVYFDPEP